MKRRLQKQFIILWCFYLESWIIQMGLCMDRTSSASRMRNPTTTLTNGDCTRCQYLISKSSKWLDLCLNSILIPKSKRKISRWRKRWCRFKIIGSRPNNASINLSISTNTSRKTNILCMISRWGYRRIWQISMVIRRATICWQFARHVHLRPSSWKNQLTSTSQTTPVLSKCVSVSTKPKSITCSKHKTGWLA